VVIRILRTGWGFCGVVFPLFIFPLFVFWFFFFFYNQRKKKSWDFFFFKLAGLPPPPPFWAIRISCTHDSRTWAFGVVRQDTQIRRRCWILGKSKEFRDFFPSSLNYDSVFFHCLLRETRLLNHEVSIEFLIKFDHSLFVVLTEF
jgi:hypothetical protein